VVKAVQGEGIYMELGRDGVLCEECMSAFLAL
jgi:hypothetical protein